ncbi:LOW QUALITY PROTEIN: hypothetical protein ACHAWF_008092, partial [Thalassiosira exigua]
GRGRVPLRPALPLPPLLLPPRTPRTEDRPRPEASILPWRASLSTELRTERLRIYTVVNISRPRAEAVGGAAGDSSSDTAPYSPNCRTRSPPSTTWCASSSLPPPPPPPLTKRVWCDAREIGGFELPNRQSNWGGGTGRRGDFCSSNDTMRRPRTTASATASLLPAIVASILLLASATRAFHMSPAPMRRVLRRASIARFSSLDYDDGDEAVRGAMDGPNDPLAAPAAPLAKMKKKEKDLHTLQRFLEVECWKLPSIRNLDRTLLAVTGACHQINLIVQRAQTDDLYGAAVDQLTGEALDANVQGEVQQQLDVLCNTLMLRAFCGARNGAVCAVARRAIAPKLRGCDGIHDRIVEHRRRDGVRDERVLAVFDPIDGTKNIDASLPVGTEFRIYRSPDASRSSKETWDMGSFLQRGTEMVAAGYCLYSTTTGLVMTLGSGVHGITLDPDRQTFLHTHLQQGVFEGVRQAHGALVVDVHNVLIDGGIYGYPVTCGAPDGKLRLLYESAPMAMIMEQAGGAGSTGTMRILDYYGENDG